jgi:hypothetical protein
MEKYFDECFTCGTVVTLTGVRLYDPTNQQLNCSSLVGIRICMGDSTFFLTFLYIPGHHGLLWGVRTFAAAGLGWA